MTHETQPPAEPANPTEALEELDFGGSGDPPKVERPRVFNPEPGREKIRGRIAIGLVILLAVVCLAGLGAVIAGKTSQEVREIMEVVLPPVVALCGSAIGFYYGQPR